MRKLIAAINITLDGFCDHTAIVPDEEIHQHYSELIKCAGTLIYGWLSYHIIYNYWPSVVINPTGKKAIDDFAVSIDNIPKIVFSNTIKKVDWKTATLAKKDIQEEVLELKQQAGKDIVVGSPGLIVSLINLRLIDEFQLCIHPIILGKGLLLFKNVQDPVTFKLLKTKTFGCGAVTLYYEPSGKE
ncbi:MAG: dihydrofolate reductase family protein [Bacteroidota bacterium]|nr:dihydrofolate reductase family protein [Bacteroidota bacterium]